MALPKLAVPTYTLKVPSSGKSVTYRPYLVKEEKILMMAMESNSEIDMITAVKNVIESCTEGKLTDTDMTMFDLEYFFTQLRAKSVGEITKIYLPCQKCEHKHESDIDLTKVKMINLPKSAKEYIKTINDEVKIKLRYIRINDLLRIMEDNKEMTDSELAYQFVISSIEEIYFGDEVYDASQQTKEELIEFVESLNGKQFLEIRKFVENSPTVATDYKFKCEKCSHENDYHLKGLANFFG